jgi:protocatechuate 3,4-dioxygenase beta subunit
MSNHASSSQAPGNVHDGHAHDLGLAHDLPRLSRRAALLMMGGAGAAVVAGCGSDSTSTPATNASSAAPSTPAAATSTAATELIPEETGGPFPADGSNGPNVLTESGVVRSDIRSSFGGLSGTADGVPLNVNLTVVNLAGGASPYAGAAVYLWHCDAQGLYSLYSQGATDQNYLRGVQVADAAGALTFTTIYPGAYQGRWPHIHFEVYPSVDAATTASGKLRTSQLALPEEVSRSVYADNRYPGSAQNLSGTSLDSDNVFSDGYSLQLATVTGDATAGYTATLTVPV